MGDGNQHICTLLVYLDGNYHSLGTFDLDDIENCKDIVQREFPGKFNDGKTTIQYTYKTIIYWDGRIYKV